MESSQTFPQNDLWEQKFLAGVCCYLKRELCMQAAIDRVMRTYGMLVNLTLEEERAAREKLTAFLAQSQTDDENKLAVEGIMFLRGGKTGSRRNPKAA